nr:LysR family transcriptional regulator [Sphingomonas sp. OK281]
MSSLRLFMQVAHNLSFSETARMTNVSQPALSRTIRLLEEMLDVRLFDRNSRNVTLTTAGETLLPIVERLTADFDHAFISLRQNFAGERGRVVVGALPSVAAGALPRMIAHFHTVYPLVEIILHDHLSGTLYQEMQDRQIDLAITTPPDEDAFRFEPLIEDDYVLVCRAGHPVDLSGPADWSIFADNPFIAMAARSSVRALTDTAFIMAAVSVKPLYECTQLATMGGLLAAGLGISALPRSTLAMLGHDTLAAHPLTSPAISRTIGLAWLADRTLPPAASAFLEHFLEHWPRAGIGA